MKARCSPVEHIAVAIHAVMSGQVQKRFTEHTCQTIGLLSAADAQTTPSSQSTSTIKQLFLEVWVQAS